MNQRTLAAIVALLVFGGAAVVLLTSRASCQEPAPTAQGLSAEEELLADLDLLASVNRLNLKTDQVKKLLVQARALQAKQAESQAARQRVLREAAEDLSRKRALLLRDDAVPQDLEKRITAHLQQLQPLVNQFQQAVVAAGGQVRAFLSPGQLKLAVGADAAERHAGEVLEGMREMSPDDFDKDAPPYAEELAKDSDALTTDDILGILSKAREMTPQQYAAKKGELTAKLAVLWTPAPDAADEQLARGLLLNPRIIPVLSDKLQTMQ